MRALTMFGQNFVSLACGNCRDLLHVLTFYSCEKSFSRKNQVLPLRNFRLLYYPGMLIHLVIQFQLYYQLSSFS